MKRRAGGNFDGGVQQLRKEVDGIRSFLWHDLEKQERMRQEIVDENRAAQREGDEDNGRVA